MPEDRYKLLMDSLSRLTRILGEMFGPNCEVLLHGLQDNHLEVTAIANGHVTGRKVGSPVTNLGLLAIHSPDGEYDEMINYTSATPDGRPLKSTSVVFRDDDGTPIAGLCINFDISDINRTKAFIDNFLGIKTEPQVQQEEFYQTMDQAFEKLINIAVEAVHKPVIAMDKADKIRVVALLDSSGVFAMKGSTERVAEVFGVSRFTIYNYLDEIRNGQPGPKNEPGS